MARGCCLLPCAAVVFLVTAVAHVAGVALTVLWPLSQQLQHFPTLAQLIHTYSPASSSLDVLLVALLQTATIGLLLLLAAASTRVSPAAEAGRRGRPRVYLLPGKARVGVRVVGPMAQLCYLGKAVAVAVLGGSNPWPGQSPGDCGLALQLLAAGCSVVLGFVEHYSAKAALAGWEHAREEAQQQEALLADVSGEGAGQRTDASGGLTEPLLGRMNGAHGGAGTQDGMAPVGGGSSKRTSGSSGSSGAAENVKADTLKKEAEHQTTIMDLVRLSGPDVHITSVAFAAGTLAALAQASVPYFTGKIVDAASIDPDPQAFRQYTVRLVEAAALCAVFSGIRGGLFTISMTRLNVRLRKRLFASLMSQEVGFYDTTKTGDVTSRLAADTTTVSDQISLNLNVMLRSMTQAVMVLCFMLDASWRLTIVTFVLVPMIVGITKVYGGFYRKLSKKVQSALAEANGVAEEAISSMTTVKAHAAEQGACAAYAAKLAEYFALLTKEALAYAAYASAYTFLPSAVSAVVLFYGGTLVLHGHMSAGALVSFMLYQSSLLGAFQNMADVFSALTAAVGAADKVMELMQRKPKIASDGTLSPLTFAGHIMLREVVFRYPARPDTRVLQGLSLQVQPGEVVALVGPSGGGKSSIVKLLQRFFTPVSGQVLLDGRDIGCYSTRWLKRRMAIVSQEPVLYARSVRRNICFGLEAEDGLPPEEQPSKEEVEEAAKRANAHEFISAWPEGYETECGEKGVQCSGGQKQRIAIARALVRQPTILLLDEATSALDADSEAVVQEALDRTMAHRTVLVIAHRLSTIQNADRILVIQGGCVAESGRHEELLEEGGTYAALVRRQLARSSSTASFATTAEGRLSRPVSTASLAGRSRG